MKAAPILPMPARTPLALSRAGAAAAVFQSAMPKVIVPIAMATLGRIFCQVQKLSLGSAASVSAVVFANGVAFVSRGASIEGVVMTRASAPGVIRVEFERTPLSRSAVSRSAALLVEERVLLSSGRSRAESSSRVVLGMLALLKESLIFVVALLITDSGVVFEVTEALSRRA